MTRIELNGRLVRNPDLRVTPAGTNALRLEVDCGERLQLALIMTGAAVPELARQLRKGTLIRASGTLRAVPLEPRLPGRPGVEVVASTIELAE